MILTIDVGLKNLAMCIMDYDSALPQDIKQYSVKLWNVYNTLEETRVCQALTKKGTVCNKKCAYKYLDKALDNDDDGLTTVFCCKTHFPKTITMNRLNNAKSKRVDEYLLQDIAKIFLKSLINIWNSNSPIFNQVTKVFIELQPKCNQKMKFVSHLIYGKLVELYSDTDTAIRFVNASKKLKCYTGPPIECHLKSNYAKRKYLSIEYTKWFLQTQFNDVERETWLPFFTQHTKADDLSDSALYQIYALQEMSKKNNKTTNRTKPRSKTGKRAKKSYLKLM